MYEGHEEKTSLSNLRLSEVTLKLHNYNDIIVFLVSLLGFWIIKGLWEYPGKLFPLRLF